MTEAAQSASARGVPQSRDRHNGGALFMTKQPMAPRFGLPTLHSRRNRMPPVDGAANVILGRPVSDRARLGELETAIGIRRWTLFAGGKIDRREDDRHILGGFPSHGGPSAGAPCRRSADLPRRLTAYRWGRPPHKNVTGPCRTLINAGPGTRRETEPELEDGHGGSSSGYAPRNRIADPPQDSARLSFHSG